MTDPRLSGRSDRVQVCKDGAWRDGTLRGWTYWTPEAARTRGGGRRPGWWGSVTYRAPSPKAGGYMSNWVSVFHADDIRQAEPPGTDEAPLD